MEPIKISSSGIVLRGSGSKSYKVAKQLTAEIKTTVTDKYVPSGASVFTVADAKGFAVGDVVGITKTTTDAWVRFRQVHDQVREGKAHRPHPCESNPPRACEVS